MTAVSLPIKRSNAPIKLLMVVFAGLCFGCNEGPRAGIPIAGCPDEKVEFLKVSESGDIEHAEGMFMELVNRDDQKLVLVDFWASWCGPCRTLSPHLEAIKKAWGDKIEIVKVDVDQSSAISGHLQITAIPDVRIFRKGTQVGDFVGAMPRADIESLLKSLE